MVWCGYLRAEGGPAPSTCIDEEPLETACPQAALTYETNFCRSSFATLVRTIETTIEKIMKILRPNSQN
jgi:hypothetical protein